MKIGEVVLKLGFINQNQLNRAISEQEEDRERNVPVETLGTIMLRLGFITEEQHNKILLEYYHLLSSDTSQPSYVRETAKTAMKAMSRKGGSGKLSEESKITLIKRINLYEEEIAHFDRSIVTLKNVEQKKIIIDTIRKEEDDIKELIKKINILRNDLESLS